MEPLAMRGGRQPLPKMSEEQLPSFFAPRRERKVTFSTETHDHQLREPLKVFASPDFSRRFRTLSNVKP